MAGTFWIVAGAKLEVCFTGLHSAVVKAATRVRLPCELTVHSRWRRACH